MYTEQEYMDYALGEPQGFFLEGKKEKYSKGNQHHWEA